MKQSSLFKLLASITAGLFFLLSSSLGVAMSILDTGKTCVASEIIVSITFDGKPIKNATVTREVEWDNVGKTDDATTTNSEGIFKLPALYMRSITRSIIPLEFVAKTLVKIKVNDDDYRIFYAIKRSEEPNNEFGGSQGKLTCELDDSEELKEFGATLIKTRCTWSS